MSEMLYTAATGAMAQQLRLETIANNLANLDTVGFKADAAFFRALMPDARDARATDKPGPDARLTDNVHVALAGSRTDFSQGALKITGNVLDLAIHGDGFFAVQTPEGTCYTRRGAFGLSPDGLLVTPDGYPVLGRSGTIRIDGKQVAIAEDGRVLVDGAEVSRLQISDFQRPYRLEKLGSALFKPADETVTPVDAAAFAVQQGYVEMSNVEPIRMMTEMLEVLRTYESHQKMMRTAEELDGKLIAETGRSA
jgi:flagellar basal-body rod protein FlgF